MANDDFYAKKLQMENAFLKMQNDVNKKMVSSLCKANVSVMALSIGLVLLGRKFHKET